MLEESLDLIVICPRYDDPVVGELRRLYKAPVWLLTNLCHAGVTVNIGGSPGFDRIRFEDRFFEPERLGGILVSGMVSLAPAGYSPADSRYLAQETFAAWLAFLRQAKCRVVNRPSFACLATGLSCTQTRAMARSVGIATIKEEVHSGAELLRRRAAGDDVACVDLFTQAAFWLHGKHAIDDQKFYSVTEVGAADDQLLLAHVGGRLDGCVITRRGIDPMNSIAAPTFHEACSASLHLANLLKIEYAFFSFSISNRLPEFCGMYLHWPGNANDRLIRSTAEALIEDLHEK
jgi:hypothetical protein